jgi:hypothetical protein
MYLRSDIRKWVKFKAWRDYYLYLLSTRLPRSVYIFFCIICFLGLFIFATLAPRGLLNGDAAIYAQQIEAVSFGKRTIHIGYYPLGVAFKYITSLETDLALNILNGLLGALCAGVVLMISYTITGSVMAGFASSLTLLTHYTFVKNAVFAEVYVPQLFFFLLTVQFTLWDRPIIAGISFAWAFLVTPSTILSAPFILLTRPKKRFVFLWAITAALIVAIVISPYIHDFLFGGRGLLNSIEAGMSISKAVNKELKELKGFYFISFFIIVGWISMVASIQYRLFAIAISCLWLFPFIFGEKFGDVPVQLPLYSILAVVAGFGIEEVLMYPKKSLIKCVVVVLFVSGIIVSGTASYSRVVRISQKIDYYNLTVQMLSECAEPDFIAVGPWSRGILLEHYLFRNSYTGVWVNTEWLDGKWGEKHFDRGWEELRTAISDSNQIWLLRPDREDIETLLLDEGYKIFPFRDVAVADKALPNLCAEELK